MKKKSFSDDNIDKNFTGILLNNVHDGIYFVDHDCSIFFWNKGAEQITGFDLSTVHGKKCTDNLINPVDESGKNLCEDDCPVKQALSDGQTHTIEAYLQHKEGHRIPVSIRAFPILGEDGEIVAAVETFHDISPKFIMPQHKKELERMQLLDPLTEVGNQRFLEIHLRSRLEEIKKYRIPFGLLYIDVDNLKEVNDSYGKPVGDQVLRSIAQTLTINIRFFDTVGRWDSDEFLAVVLNVDEGKLDFVGNKLRLLVEKSNIMVGPQLVRATVSVGATLAFRVDTLDILITRARSLMDHSKWLGRNKVSVKTRKEEEDF
ncbi:MAG: sensor domain-containing diguanylate cyclase [Candidatus Aminicenantes bacterium]|nr:MAG: sensor domain-containing diguanylate cyclase [Candidatus Aminicenantes bacterium]